MGFLSAFHIEVEGPMAGKASCFKGQEDQENATLMMFSVWA